MQLRLNLFAKAMILVAVPLFCEIGFTCGLFGMVQQLDQQAMAEHSSREALASLNSIYQRLTQSSELVASIFTQNGNASVMELHELTGIIPGDLSTLRRELADDPDALKALDRLDRDIISSLRILDEVFSLVENGNKIGAIQHLRDLKHSLPDLSQQLDELRSRTTRDADYSFDKQRRDRKQMELLLKYAIAFNVVLAVAVAVFVNRNLTSRLAVMVENTSRLAENKQLMPPVGGNDEIAHLDKVFKDMANALAMAEQRRKEIEMLKQEFVSMISHDLRTPLTSIQVFLSMLKKGMLGQVNEAVEKKAEMADRNATRLINLINDLLDIDKMESGQLAISCEPTSLSSVIDRALESVRGFADQQGIQIDWSPSNSADVQLDADGDRLVQVFVNLLGNAVKFSPRDSHVRIVVENGINDVCVNIIDQGRGVPEHLRTAIFERFKQVSAKDSTEKKGTGLGLAICKAIVEQHGGTIGVDSVENQGSTFWFRLPVKNSVPAKVGR